MPRTDAPRPRAFLHQNLAAALAYALGLLGGLLFLWIEKENRYVRFHALQSLVTFSVAGVLYLVILNLPLVGWLLRILFMIAVVALWILLMFKAINGERYKVPLIGDWVAAKVR